MVNSRCFTLINETRQVANDSNIVFVTDLLKTTIVSTMMKVNKSIYENATLIRVNLGFAARGY